MTTMESKRATFRQRYEQADDGLRFQDLTYTGNFVGMEPVTDGIKGDKMIRARAKSKVLEKVSQGRRAARPVHHRRAQRPEQLPGLEHLGRAGHARHRGRLAA